MNAVTNCVWMLLIAMLTLGVSSSVVAETIDGLKPDSQVAPTIVERFTPVDVRETPDFQKHVIPLMSRMGCNGRSCHGSFQGRGGFILSLFGYDFKADHAAITQGESPRVDIDSTEDSLIIAKPTDDNMHEGGQIYEVGSWEHRVLKNWIDAGAKFDEKQVALLDHLEVTPREIVFSAEAQTQPLTAVAVWADGSREDVTPLCRFTTNDDQVALIDREGIVTSHEPGDTHVVIAYDKAVVTVPVIRPVSEFTGDNYPEVPTPTKVDQLVVQKLRKLGMIPSELTTDEQFLRRVSLDIAGTLPTPSEVRTFLADSDPDKRSKKIDQLLETPAYVAKMTTLLCDLTGNNDQQLVNVSPMRVGPAQEWYDWIYDRVEKNMPYDQIAEGIILARSRLEGESYREYCEEMSDMYREGNSFADREYMTHYWARREFRQPEERAIAFAYAFMGVRIQCAQCHKHPFDVWSKNDFDEFKTFFSGARFANQPIRNDKAAFEEYQEILDKLDIDKKLRGNQQRREFAKKLKDGETVPFPELVVTPVRAANNGKKSRKERLAAARSPEARVLGEEAINLRDYEDAREPVMDWLRAKDNPYFARAIVNRVWATYFSAGIVNPTDDLSLGNPPSNEPLLAYLAAGFVANDYDLKWLHREIANSRTYQLSWIPNETNRFDSRNFSRAQPRRLPAEVAYDIIRQATADDRAMGTYLTNLNDRAIAIPGTRINGSASYPLQIFGRSERASNCDCDRSMEATLLQTVFLQNDFSLHSAIKANDSWLGEMEQTMQPKLNKQSTESQRLQAQITRLNQQLAKGRDAVQRLKKSGNKERLQEIRRKVTAGTVRLQKLRTQLASAQKKEAKQPVAEIAFDSPAEMVEEAYLRTLSRKPSEKEMTISLAHLKESGDPVNGLQDLMWALLNTKEFIVNH
ncbi:DUF1549 domain-containing protein [Blastopirellula marina]|uniref:BIG2 domain-containing protein n=1 Tax=Blastopirellula marina TaxID=124 RepID=A0A2S8GUQ5_9BACT|nr:DUF1549 domain-containing protein [Blastopirellula marina]PQO47784.1 hypothetical protein C5Y93_01710 [Blastopirellula marina]